MVSNTNFLKICFGVALFLYAMSVLEISFKLLAGGFLTKLLKIATKSRFKSFLFGLISTGIMQSSGLVSVLAISFLSASMITMTAGLAIIFGANLGTTTGAWLVAGLGLKINIAHYAMPMIVFGILMSLNKEDKVKGGGYFLLSLGFLFLGIDYMKNGFDDIKATLDLSKYAMSGFSGVLIYTFIGIVATMIMQSSHATLTLTLAALATNQINYENSIAIAIGSNVGSTIMAVIGSLNSNIEGKRLMIAHIFFNVTVAFLAIILINPFIILVDYTAQISNIAEDDFTIKLAIFHTYFNLFGVFIFYPFTSRIAKLLPKILKSKPKKAVCVYLDESTLEFPDSAVEVLVKELKRLYKITSDLILKSISIDPAMLKSNLSETQIISRCKNVKKWNFDENYDENFKPLYSAIVDFSTKVKTDDIKIFIDIRHFGLLLAEAIKDIRNTTDNFSKNITSSNEILQDEYNYLRKNIVKVLRICSEILEQNDTDIIKEFLSMLETQKINFESLSLNYAQKYAQNSKISPENLTSLMNDSSLCGNMTKKFIKITDMILQYDFSNKILEENS